MAAGSTSGEQMADIRERLAACPIPEDARADWEYTNHYEITSASNDIRAYWWIYDITEALMDGSNTEPGKRLGAVLDYAVAYRRDVAALLTEIDRLTGGAR